MNREALLRAAVRAQPMDPRTHAALADHFMASAREPFAEWHYFQALAAGGNPGRLYLALARCYLRQSDTDQARLALENARAHGRQGVPARLLEMEIASAARDRKAAWAALTAAEQIEPGRDYTLAEARLREREGRYAEAIDDLTPPSSPQALLERGRIKDRAGDHAGAWADWEAGKAQFRALGYRYRAAAANGLLDRLEAVFSAPRALLPAPARPIADGPLPVFVMGFPRSGTTMVEQMLTAHSEIAAGDELPILASLAGDAQRLLDSVPAYPELLTDAALFSDRADLADRLRAEYLRRATARGVARARYFTDKMPLNETHLGLAALLFPDAPIIHVRRHPLDIVVANFETFLTHGHCQAFAVESIAHHLGRVSALVEIYRRALPARYLAMRYEDICADPAAAAADMLSHCGVAFEPACGAPHENRRFARTASHAQVTEAVHSRSVNRWRHHRAQLERVAEGLGSGAAASGYS